MSFFHSFIGQYSSRCNEIARIRRVCMRLHEDSSLGLVFAHWSVMKLINLIFAGHLQEKHGRVANVPRSDFGSKN